MRFFFYGTLMHRAFLSRVLGRRVGARELVAARLSGWRRTGAKGEHYPIVLRQRGAALSGVMLSRVTAAETARLAAYESAGYTLAASVAWAGGIRRSVRFFAPLPGAYTPANKDWDFIAWRRRRIAEQGGTRWSASRTGSAPGPPRRRPRKALLSPMSRCV